MPDTLIHNANIRTMDAGRPRATWLLIRGDRIAALGSGLPPDAATRIDAGGRLVLPGFQDAHVHLLSGGTDLATAAQLYEVQTIAALQAAVADHAANHPGLALVMGSGWQPGMFGDDNLTAAVIDAVVPDRPAVLFDSSFHNACLNSASMRLAGLVAGMPDPANGHFVTDAAGKPTGMLHEDAVPWAMARLPELAAGDHRAGLLAGMAHANQNGITGILDPRITDHEAGIYGALAAEGGLTLWVAGAALVKPDDSPAEALARLGDYRSRYPGPEFHVQSAKFFMDGVFENRTAALLAPYADIGGNSEPMFGSAQTEALMVALDAARFQIHVHVIGDAATRRALDGLAAARAANGAWPSLPQLAHLQLTDPADHARLSELGVMANIQPLWARLDPVVPDIALDMIGADRLGDTYAFRKMIDAGARYCLSSDWPVSTLNPFEIIETAVTRQARSMDSPREPFLPDQAMTVEQCVFGYTAEAAAACWRASFTGQLRPGFSADLILLDQDIFGCAPDRISETRVSLTIFRGRIIHQAAAFG